MPKIIIILGSGSDRQIVEESGMLNILDEIGVSWEVSIISAHRNPKELKDYCLKTEKNGALAYIGVAGMTAVLPGAIASNIQTRRPVIGVPLVSEILDGLDALLAMVRMPSGIPVLVPGIGKSGLRNAAIAACQIVAVNDSNVDAALQRFISANNKRAYLNVLQSRRRKSS